MRFCGRSRWPMGGTLSRPSYVQGPLARTIHAPESVSPELLNELARPDTGVPDHPGPFFVLGAHEGGELLGRTGRGIGAGGAKLRLDFGRAVSADQLAMRP